MRSSSHSTGKNMLAPIDAEVLLHGLRLTTGKAAVFCAISRRQLCYWTDKGIIETKDGDMDNIAVEDEETRRVYDFIALQKVLLIKQLLEQGQGLKRATREVESYLSQLHDHEISANSDSRQREEVLNQQIERLEELAELVRSAVQRGRVNLGDLRDIMREIQYFLEIMAYEESATLQLQKDATDINQFRDLIDQLALHVEEKLADVAPALRRAMR